MLYRTKSPSTIVATLLTFMLEVGDAVAGGVPGKNAGVKAQLALYADRESGAADEGECLVARGARLGIDPGQVDLVALSAAEIVDGIGVVDAALA